MTIIFLANFINLCELSGTADSVPGNKGLTMQNFDERLRALLDEMAVIDAQRDDVRTRINSLLSEKYDAQVEADFEND
jgi:hypothetical protein